VRDAETLAWLERRRNYVTASQLAVVMGDNPFTSRDKLFKEKVLGDFPVLDFPAPWWGLFLEDKILEAFGILSGLETQAGQEFVARGELSATLDARVLGPGEDSHRTNWINWHWNAEGSLPAVADAKNTSQKSFANWRRYGVPKDGIPKYYWWQLQAQMHCTGVDTGILVVKVGARELHAFVEEYDELAMELAVDKVRDFMKEVRKAREEL